MMKRFVLLALSLWLAACTQTNEVVEQISVSFQNLPALQNAYYEVWVTFYQFNAPPGGDSPTHEGEYVSIGTFTVAADGSLRNLSGGAPNLRLPNGVNTQLLKDIVVSVQTEPTEQPQAILMGGAFYGDAVDARADLDIAYSDAFGTDFARAGGVCSIVAPTSPPDSNSGVWFVQLGTSVGAGLTNLPALRTGWRYEGWVIRRRPGAEESYLSTGKFTRADSADLDGPGPFAGTAGQPFNFPGQDFVQGAGAISDLRTGEYSFMVTLEPFPDNTAEPFFLTLLKSPEPATTASRTVTLANAINATAPRGKIVIQR